MNIDVRIHQGIDSLTFIQCTFKLALLCAFFRILAACLFNRHSCEDRHQKIPQYLSLEVFLHKHVQGSQIFENQYKLTLKFYVNI